MSDVERAGPWDIQARETKSLVGSPALRVAEGKKPEPPEKEHSERK